MYVLDRNIISYQHLQKKDKKTRQKTTTTMSSQYLSSPTSSTFDNPKNTPELKRPKQRELYKKIVIIKQSLSRPRHNAN